MAEKTSEYAVFKTKGNRLLVFKLNGLSKLSLDLKEENVQRILDKYIYSDIFNKKPPYNLDTHKLQDNILSIANDKFLTTLFEDLDVHKTNILNEQIRSFSYKKQPDKFRNYLNQPYKHPLILGDLNFQIKDEDIPNDVKNLGCTLEPEDRFWKAVWNEKEEKYEYFLRNNKGVYEKQPFDRTRAMCIDKSIIVMRNHFEFEPEISEARRNEIINDYKNGKMPTDKKEKAFLDIYKNEKNNNDKLKEIIYHEYKHIKNSMFFETVYLNRENKQLSLNDLYRICIEDERSSYLSSTINKVNEYLKCGVRENKWDDIECFNTDQDIKIYEILKNKTNEERKEFLKNPKNYINFTLEYFTTELQNLYDINQISKHEENGKEIKGTMIDALLATAANLPVDEGDISETFKNLQKLYYHFAFYNPDTDMFEQRFASNYINEENEVKLTAYAQNKIIPDAQKEFQNRKDNYEKVQNTEIDELIKIGRRVMRSGKVESVNANNLFIESYDADEISLYTNENNAGWSNNFEQYYKQLENYQKITKNNEEYKFKLGEDIVCYTSDNTLQVSENSQYKTYLAILNEPSNKGTTINFMNNLTKEQSLMLYAACLACGRKMKGNLPQNLDGLENLHNIPTDIIQKMKNELPSLTSRKQTNTGGSCSLGRI